MVFNQGYSHRLIKIRPSTAAPDDSGVVMAWAYRPRSMERDVLPACLPCGDGEYITAYNQALNQLGIHRIKPHRVLTAAFTCTQYAVGCCEQRRVLCSCL